MDPKILEELKNVNKTISDLLLFQLCQAGYSKEQIRDIVGTIDNNRLTKIRAGRKNKAS